MTILDSLSGTIVLADPRRTLRITGKDAVSWLNGLVTCDVASVDERRGSFGLLLTKQGKVVSELEIVRAGQSLLLGLDPSVFDSVRELLDRYLVMEDAELEEAPELFWLRLVGRGAETASAPSALARGSIDWLRVGGVALVAAETHRAQVEAELRAGGAIFGRDEDWEALRLSHSFPKFGVDYGPEDNPHEASLERRAVSWTKGCYLGQEVVCMQDMRGRVKRRLVALEVDDGGVTVGADVRARGESEPVGRVTSSVTLGSKSFAMARLRAPFFEGTEPLEVLGTSARIVAPSAG